MRGGNGRFRADDLLGKGSQVVNCNLWNWLEGTEDANEAFPSSIVRRLDG